MKLQHGFQKILHSYNMDVDRIAVDGDSVGCNIAAAVTMLVKSRDGPKILF